jgi:glyoxylase-like metal-dependent hydrolase (beta-lactamase superfamily II)
MEDAELAPGLWSWTATQDNQVRSFYVEAEDATIVVDPLVPADEADRFWRAFDRDVERRARPVAVLLTQAEHAGSAGDVAARFGAEVWGHEAARPNVGGAPFHPLAPGDTAPGGARVLPFEQEPDGSGTPLYFPGHAALAVGDVFISVDGELRIWWAHGASTGSWYRERLLPSLRSWLELPVEHVLVAHGEQVAGGRDAIAAALERKPYELE